MMLSLSRAIQEDRLDEFIQQANVTGVGPISEAEFDETASTVIKTPLQSGQISRSLRPCGLPEK